MRTAKVSLVPIAASTPLVKVNPVGEDVTPSGQEEAWSVWGIKRSAAWCFVRGGLGGAVEQLSVAG
jgi:hypothetical protein